MNCPQCDHEVTEVKDSRPDLEENAIRRRRLCVGCGHRFTTFEAVREVAPSLDPNDCFKYRRQRQMRALFQALGLADQLTMLSLASRLAGDVAESDIVAEADLSVARAAA